MGAFHSVPTEDNLEDLAERTGFSLEQVKNLHRRFKYLSGGAETLRKENLESISDLAFNPIRKQIIQAFFDKRNFGQNGAGSVQEIGFEEFLIVLANFRPPAPRITEEERETIKREKLRFLFNMHDTDNDGTITLEEYRHVVEELLSSSGAIGKETAKAISDAAMLEVASVTVGQMRPDEFYEGITFEHFQQILKGLDIDSKMSIRFMNVNTSNMRCGK
ncbi:tescalcin a [Chanos chanos]|uniref:Calcineurin B homologous protein 3 n=1 Tax=Chanos chanos TaxID=29144 RepID=A0A6J2WU90_CHACN|nr:calcineurin B homologous protein 3 [Chanos chanos]